MNTMEPWTVLFKPGEAKEMAIFLVVLRQNDIKWTVSHSVSGWSVAIL